MKKAVGLLVLSLGFAVIQPAQAEETKTIAIIDTAIDSSRMPNVVYEACFTTNKSCPNKTNFQEGVGSAMVNDWTISGVDHGFNVATVAAQVNPSIKIVFVRISDEKVYDTKSIIRNDGGSLALASKWISDNSVRLNINAVSISQSRQIDSQSNEDVAKACPKDSIFEQSVANLNSKNILTFVATGNGRIVKGVKTGFKNQVGFPACVPGVIGVGGLDNRLNVASYSNSGPGLDLVVSGDAKIRPYLAIVRNDTKWMIDLSGTSIATPVAATLAASRSIGLGALMTELPKIAGYSYISK